MAQRSEVTEVPKDPGQSSRKVGSNKLLLVAEEFSQARLQQSLV